MKVWKNILKKQYTRGDERGQSLVEAALAFVFLMLLIIASFELAQVFSVYSALTNAVREGALYASSKDDLRTEVCLNVPLECDGNDDTTSRTLICEDLQLDPNNRTQDSMYTYCERVRRVIIVRRLDPDSEFLTIFNPSYTPLVSSPGRFKIRLRAQYRLGTLFTSSIELPILGRMGLPQAYTISYTMIVETRSF